MFIQTEETPNPETLKFIPGCVVMEEGTASFLALSDCYHSPLARRLLEIPGVLGVFFGADFITITKAANRDWYVLKPPILGIIMEHFVARLPVIVQDVTQSGAPVGSTGASHYLLDDQDPLVVQIKELIEMRVRPMVAQDGGDITLEGFEDGIVYVRLQGACSGCPSSSVTLKSGIENMLKYYVPEIQEVRAV